MDFLTQEMVNEAAAHLEQRIKVKPRVGMILGSGLGLSLILWKIRLK